MVEAMIEERLPEDYWENGMKGFGPIELVGRKLDELHVTRRGDMPFNGETYEGECPFCEEEVETVSGHHVRHRGVDNVGVGVCPNCRRVWGEY